MSVRPGEFNVEIVEQCWGVGCPLRADRQYLAIADVALRQAAMQIERLIRQAGHVQLPAVVSNLSRLAWVGSPSGVLASSITPQASAPTLTSAGSPTSSDIVPTITVTAVSSGSESVSEPDSGRGESDRNRDSSSLGLPFNAGQYRRPPCDDTPSIGGRWGGHPRFCASSAGGAAAHAGWRSQSASAARCAPGDPRQALMKLMPFVMVVAVVGMVALMVTVGGRDLTATRCF